MSSALYSMDVLRLAASIPWHERLPAPMGSAEKRSPVCGSRVVVDVMLDAAGRIATLGQEVRACALGQASAALMAGHAIGRDAAELVAARDALAAFLAGDREDPSDWPGLGLFAAARAYPARHASIRLPFEAIVEAVVRAGEAQAA